jgi:hypothetical protein
MGKLTTMTEIRLIHVTTQETLRESGQPVNPPTVKVIATAVVTNPLAGKPLEADLTVLELMSAEVTAILGAKAISAIEALGLSASDIRGYGKGAIVGTDGELEHTAAVLHPRFGAPVRAVIGGGADIIPGTKKVGAPGASITMPIGNKDDRWEFDDMDSAEVSIGDAPRANEMLISVIYSVGGRPHARVTKVK